MYHGIKESDWKKFKKLRPLALQRYCEKVMGDVSKVINKEQEDAHERYLEMFNIVDEGDKLLSMMFDAFSRSKATIQLVMYCENDLLTDEELAQLSDETREIIHSLIEFRNR